MNSAEFLSPDLIRLALILGMVLSVFLYEKSHLTTGSIVVPGFLGIHIFDPWIVVSLIFNAWLCYLIVHRMAPHFWFMQNKTKFHSLLIVSVSLQLVWNFLSAIPVPLAITGSFLAGIGYVIPGLIAHDMSRNGPLKTGINVTLVSSLVGLSVFGLVIGFPEAAIASQGFERIPFQFDLVLILTLSTVGSVLLKLKTPVRSAGYVTAAYLVFFCGSPFIWCRYFSPRLQPIAYAARC